MTSLSVDELTRKELLVFEFIQERAVGGGRAPTRDELDRRTGGGADICTALARRGFWRIEVFARNWRVITLLAGTHSGTATAAPPFANTGPYLKIDRGGARRV